MMFEIEASGATPNEGLGIMMKLEPEGARHTQERLTERLTGHHRALRGRLISGADAFHVWQRVRVRRCRAFLGARCLRDTSPVPAGPSHLMRWPFFAPDRDQHPQLCTSSDDCSSCVPEAADFPRICHFTSRSGSQKMCHSTFFSISSFATPC
ncbi:uncharacterized protein VK521_012772 isoform 2-T2 [Ammospiza maritima maritima]